MNGRPLALGAAAIGSALIGGVLFAFSSFVMPALRRIPAPQGIAAMQSINRQATGFAFGGLIAVTLLLAIGVGMHTVRHRDQPGASWVGVGTISVMIALAITGGYNVPRNNQLATLDASTPEAAHYWSTFLTEWIIANHVRASFCIIAAISYTIALRRP